MNINIKPVTETEFLQVRDHFEVKAKALALKSTFVDNEGQLQRKPVKPWFYGGYDQSKFLRADINGETFIIGAGNTITGILTDVLPEACQRYQERFGTRDAHAVVKAIFDTHPEEGYQNMEEYENHLAHEKFALVFRLLPDGQVDSKVLRLDLFRMIKPEKKDDTKFEFIGGLMHALKHFTYRNLPLSTNRENYNLDHPTQIIGWLISAFFQTSHTKGG